MTFISYHDWQGGVGNPVKCAPAASAPGVTVISFGSELDLFLNSERLAELHRVISEVLAAQAQTPCVASAETPTEIAA